MANLNYNVCHLGGRLTRDIEIKKTPNGKSVCSFTLAINRASASGEQPQSDFLNCVAWEKTAEFISKYFHKGSNIMLDARAQSRTYDDKDGKKVFVTEFYVDKAYFVDSKSDSQTSGGGNEPYDIPGVYATPKAKPQPSPVMEVISDDGELPF